MDKDTDFATMDRLQSAMQLGVDLKARRIFLVGEIDDDTAYKLITTLNVLDSSKGTIFITLSSPGGLEAQGYAIYDAIRLAKNKVVIEGLGHVQSIAAAIMQAADVRRIAPECRFMIHNGTITLHGDTHVDAIAAIAREVAFHSDRYHKILSTRSGQSVEKIRGMCEAETFLDAQETVKMGFADEVIEY